MCCQSPRIRYYASGIAKELRIFELFDSHNAITPAKKAWITIKAKKYGLNPIMVHAGIKAHYTKMGK